MDSGLLTRLIIAIFATYRLAQLVAMDDGPLDLFATLRGLTSYDTNGNPRTGKLWESLHDLLMCPYCLGVWFGGITTLLTAFSVPLDFWTGLLFWLAVSGGQCVLQAVSETPRP